MTAHVPQMHKIDAHVDKYTPTCPFFSPLPHKIDRISMISSFVSFLNLMTCGEGVKTLRTINVCTA